MKHDKYVGFTIIETMLFLGITGLLIMGVLVGAGTSINVQRYRDSVSSLQSTLQKQFSEVSNVSNSGVGDPGCGGLRGQSDCVILGRFIKATDSKTLSIQSIVGTIPALPIASTNDVDVLKAYNIKVSAANSDTYNIEWGASIASQIAPSGVHPIVFSMLILRSPISGTIRTFVSDNTTTPVLEDDIANLLTPENLVRPVTMCVESNGLFDNGKASVTVTANASSAGGIETNGEATSGC